MVKVKRIKSIIMPNCLATRNHRSPAAIATQRSKVLFKWFIPVVCEKYNKEYQRYQIVRSNTTLL